MRGGIYLFFWLPYPLGSVTIIFVIKEYAGSRLPSLFLTPIIRRDDAVRFKIDHPVACRMDTTVAITTTVAVTVDLMRSKERSGFGCASFNVPVGDTGPFVSRSRVAHIQWDAWAITVGYEGCCRGARSIISTLAL